MYRITSIKRPGRLLNFSIFRGGGRAFIREGRLFWKGGGGAFNRSNTVIEMFLHSNIYCKERIIFLF